MKAKKVACFELLNFFIKKLLSTKSIGINTVFTIGNPSENRIPLSILFKLETSTPLIKRKSDIKAVYKNGDFYMVQIYTTINNTQLRS